jgi:lipoprotein-releasing system ATP-binding protein
VGPSGSGKSTLLNILGTLDTPSGGGVRVGDVDPFALDAKELAAFRSRSIGFIFQDHHLLPQCTALENVLVARMAAGKVRPEDVDRARSLFARVSLTGRETHHPYQMSGGERQRVVIARALMNRPPLLLADEPTGNLDSHTARLVAELLRDLITESRAALVVVTHSTALAELFPRQMRMDDGRLVPA